MSMIPKELSNQLASVYWNYRWFEFSYQGEKYYEMREVYYDINDNITSWAGTCNTFHIESVQDARDLEKQAKEAMAKPLLAIVNKNNKRVVVELDRTLLDTEENNGAKEL